MKRLLSLAILAALVGAGVWGYFYARSRGGAPKYRVAKVERGPITAAVSATGNLNAVVTVQVGSQVSGQIKELLVDFNSVVRKGQVIARIDAEIFEAKVAQARADVEGARAGVLNQQAQVDKARADVENARAALATARANTAKSRVAVLDAKRDLDRKTALLQRHLIAQADRDTAEAAHDSATAQFDASLATERSVAASIRSAEAQLAVMEAALDSARAQVKQKEAALKQTQVDLDHATITAPVDGVVVSRAVDVGQTVAASLQAPILFTIARDLTKMQVETSVDEADIGRIKEGDRATFSVDAFPNDPFTGEVAQIRKAALVVQNVVTYVVVVTVPNPGGKLLPGMTANVKLVTAEKPSVLKVANAALRFRPSGVEAGPPGGARPSATTGAPPSGGPPGRESIESIRERLVRDLKLTEAQQGTLNPILEDSRAQFRSLAGAPEGERQATAQRIREATRTRIREILTPEQRAIYDQSAGAGGGPGAGRGGRGTGTSGRVWLVSPDGSPKAVTVRLGLSDGASTEIVGGEITEGQEVIVGVAGAGAGGARPGPSTPGGPRLRL
jgi:HlyD family secretion protein